eukprot:scaffold240389_cov28-Tisochrysis_lutea.AAC.1
MGCCSLTTHESSWASQPFLARRAYRSIVARAFGFCWSSELGSSELVRSRSVEEGPSGLGGVGVSFTAVTDWTLPHSTLPTGDEEKEGFTAGGAA